MPFMPVTVGIIRSAIEMAKTETGDSVAPVSKGQQSPDHADEHEMIRRLVREHQARLGSMRANPKGMTHGEVQSDLWCCAKILGR